MSLRSLLRPPDDLEVEAGGRGELLVARIRLWILLLLAPIPIVNAIELAHWENLVGAAVLVTALIIATLIYRAVRRDPRRSWIGLVSTTVDVTLITLTLSVFLLFGEPLTTTNSLVVFGVYYLAIMATALRHDPRLSMLAGVLAVAQYAVLVSVAASTFDLLPDGVSSERYGSFSWSSQIARLVLLTAASALATVIVLRQGELLHRSSIDSLTSLYNRGAFAERLETEVTRTRRHKHPLSVAMIDIDHFKYINDDHGHAAGDDALMQFAHALRTEFRTTDLVARYGGEEFVVMMPETPPEGATVKLQRFVRYIAERRFRLARSGEPLRMTVSAGVAGVPGDLQDPGELLAAADARLITAKRAGRNSVIGAGDAAPDLG
ncbi:MAG TPA: GGDEF domain-containing protein [Longimicrobiales bacterium]|nr:GGDEF domain-containing protein [Longimicrobiales bacterium]